MKIHPVGAELTHSDGQAGMTNVIGDLWNYAKT